ncbi:MAG: GGDEF domain-containing protein [Granulosicoccus sp.]|nr:GGDEF domain-containing protein [Granulosicoccus sp.]
MKRALRASLSLKLTFRLAIMMSAAWIPVATTFIALGRNTVTLDSKEVLITITLFALTCSAMLILSWWYCLYPLAKRVRQTALEADRLLQGQAYRPIGDRYSDELGDLSRALDRIARRMERERSERERDQQNLSHQATHDELTGLSNRKFGNATIARLSRSATQVPTSILFLDLDGFKAVNDTCGHATGDEILVAVSLRLKAILHKDTVLIRWGGDEFVIVLPGADHRAAISVAQDVSDLFRQPIATSQGVHKLGCSIGMSTTRHDASLEDVLEEADASMYDQKKKRKRMDNQDPVDTSTSGEVGPAPVPGEDEDRNESVDWLDKAA